MVFARPNSGLNVSELFNELVAWTSTDGEKLIITERTRRCSTRLPRPSPISFSPPNFPSSDSFDRRRMKTCYLRGTRDRIEISFFVIFVNVCRRTKASLPRGDAKWKNDRTKTLNDFLFNDNHNARRWNPTKLNGHRRIFAFGSRADCVKCSCPRGERFDLFDW